MSKKEYGKRDIVASVPVTILGSIVGAGIAYRLSPAVRNFLFYMKDRLSYFKHKFRQCKDDSCRMKYAERIVILLEKNKKTFEDSITDKDIKEEIIQMIDAEIDAYRNFYHGRDKYIEIYEFDLALAGLIFTGSVAGTIVKILTGSFILAKEEYSKTSSMVVYEIKFNCTTKDCVEKNLNRLIDLNSSMLVSLSERRKKGELSDKDVLKFIRYYEKKLVYYRMALEELQDVESQEDLMKFILKLK